MDPPILPRGLMTPLGRPVDPEVSRIFAMVSSVISRLRAVTAAASTDCSSLENSLPAMATMAGRRALTYLSAGAYPKASPADTSEGFAKSKAEPSRPRSWAQEHVGDHRTT